VLKKGANLPLNSTNNVLKKNALILNYALGVKVLGQMDSKRITLVETAWTHVLSFNLASMTGTLNPCLTANKMLLKDTP